MPNYLEAEDWKTSQKEYLFYQLMIKKFSLKMSINLLNCKTERVVELSIVYNLIFRPMQKYGSVSMVWHLTCCSHCFLCMVKQRIQYIDWNCRNKIQEFHKSCWILWRMEVRYSCKLLEIMSLPFWYCLHIVHLFLFVCLSLKL